MILKIYKEKCFSYFLHQFILEVPNILPNISFLIASLSDCRDLKITVRANLKSH